MGNTLTANEQAVVSVKLHSGQVRRYPVKAGYCLGFLKIMEKGETMAGVQRRSVRDATCYAVRGR